MKVTLNIKQRRWFEHLLNINYLQKHHRNYHVSNELNGYMIPYKAHHLREWIDICLENNEYQKEGEAHHVEDDMDWIEELQRSYKNYIKNHNNDK